MAMRVRCYETPRGEQMSTFLRICAASSYLVCNTSGRAAKRICARDGFLVNISESQMDLSRNGVTAHGCILVLPDGHFHLERRRQQLPASTATLQIFESSLDQTQLETLLGILNDEGIRNLPPYIEPTIPMAVPFSAGSTLKLHEHPRCKTLDFGYGEAAHLKVRRILCPTLLKKVGKNQKLRCDLCWHGSIKWRN